MAYEYDQIIQAQAARLQAARAQATADLEAARHAEDPERVNQAADDILRLDADMDRLGNIASRFYSQQQARPQESKFGLSNDEIDVARSHPDPHMTNEQKEELYARNRQRYQHMRATGQYRDDQGYVRR
jgi:hypothetical protein